jgi:outer membrane receptor for ferrienterochelin and colicin
MKNSITPVFLTAAFVMYSLTHVSCKGHSSETTTKDSVITITTDHTVQRVPDTAIVISADDSLNTKIADAVKDFPGVSATVNGGVITLTGNITRDKLPRLMMAVNALHPKKINNNLTIQ